MTYAQLYTSIKADLEAQMQTNIPVIGKAMLWVFAVVQAGKLWLFYLALAGVQKNIFVDLADPESMGGTLQRFGRVKLNRDPFPATAGVYTATGSTTFSLEDILKETAESDFSKKERKDRLEEELKRVEEFIMRINQRASDFSPVSSEELEVYKKILEELKKRTIELESN